MPYRLIYLGLGLMAAASIAFGIAFSGGDEPAQLPSPLISVSPEPGDLVLPQSTVEIVIETGYVIELYVDGWPVTDLIHLEGTGVFRWAPSPSSATITEWAPGEHHMRVVWDTESGLPDPGQFEWSFRVG